MHSFFLLLDMTGTKMSLQRVRPVKEISVVKYQSQIKQLEQTLHLLLVIVSILSPIVVSMTHNCIISTAKP